ncbi:hypothetical protein V6N11_021125 [Hibiscus sabdariffa]|uniref:Uncharacterized protein n=1 Tax=Hibiscus sabdariffa TaxID=183260 RepID=A0ABR2NGA8_9ROSI
MMKLKGLQVAIGIAYRYDNPRTDTPFGHWYAIQALRTGTTSPVPILLLATGISVRHTVPIRLHPYRNKLFGTGISFLVPIRVAFRTGTVRHPYRYHF